jgi:hypothetical protein
MIRSFSILGIRLIGIYFLFTALFSGTSVVLDWLRNGAGDGGRYDPYTVLFLGSFFAVGALMLVFSARLGELAARGLGEGKGTASGQDGVVVGTFLIGLYWLVGTLPGAVVRSAYLAANASGDVGPGYYDAVLTDWFAVLLALLIMARSGWVGEVFARLRKK